MNVRAETLYEAVALAVRAFREHECAPDAASELDVEARGPGVTHTVSSSADPSDKIMKERLKALLGS